MRLGKRICFMFVCLCLGAGALLVPSVRAGAGAGQTMNIYCIYLGEQDNNAGDSVLVESQGEYLLMDLGSVAGYPYVKNFLQERGVKKLSLYISHTHADHTGGLRDGEGYDQLMGDFEVEHVYLPDRSLGSAMNLSWNHSKFVSLYQKHYPSADINSCLTYLKAGSVFSFGNVRANVIGPVGMENRTVSDYMGQVNYAQKKAENNYLNDCSLVSILTCGNTRYFTGGDIDTYEEKMLVQKYGQSLKCDIYKMSHHGYSNSSTQEIMDCIRPSYSFAPNSGDANGFTSPETTNRRKVYSAMSRCSKYGFVYLTGAEKVSVAFKTTNNSTKIYRTNNLSQNLTGYVAVKGADGVYVTEDRYLIGPDGKPMTGVQLIDGKKYYFGTGGCQEYGRYTKGVYAPWRSYTDNGIKNFRCYDQYTHEMMTGFIQQDGGKTYYCDPVTGFRHYGFLKIAGKTYYFGNAGTMYKDRWLAQDGKDYYFKKNGAMAKGWTKVSVWKFYFKKDGSRATKLTKIGKKYYYLDISGSLKRTSCKIKLDGVVLIFNKKGVLQNVPVSEKTDFTSVKAKKGSVRVKWKKVSKASGYTVYISSKKKSGYKEAASVQKNKRSVTLRGLARGRYYLKVASYREVGGIKFYSKKSRPKKIKAR